ncbi:peroxide stress protein YaaA, partial [Xanthomonas citri pv. citri]
KNLNKKNDLPFDFSQHYTQPALMAHACQLMAELKTLAPTDLSALMSISAKLGQLNAVRNQNWRWHTTQPFSTDHADIPAKAALYLFDGDVYTGLAAQQMTEQQVHYVNERLGILSGLYGLLKPLDLMLP